MVNFKKRFEYVLVFLSDSGENEETVTVQSMVNEYFLVEKITFEDRDKAYDFIECYTSTMAKKFLLREAINEGAIN